MRPSTLLLTFTLAGCDAPTDAAPTDAGPTCGPVAPSPPACGTGPAPRAALIPGPADPGFSPGLHAHIGRYDRLFDAFFAAPMGVSTEVSVPIDDAQGRADLTEISSGRRTEPPRVTGARWMKVAGGYAGVGIAADAYRYGTLRDEGAPCDEVDAARVQLVRALEGLHRASVITGAPGVIARGYATTDDAGYGALVSPVPLFDDAGAPLPTEKNNGTWREDASGSYPDYRWEDSCSRDMFVGWMAGFAAAWDVAGADPTLPTELMSALRDDARAIARSLMTVQESGYDLEIRDADGRRTYHGILHEESFDRTYAPGLKNGMNALIALGSVASLSLAADDPEIDAWIAEVLLEDRRLHEIARDTSGTIDFGVASNYSNYNMAFLGGLLAERYLCDSDAREAVAEGLDAGLYAIPGRERQPAEQGQTLYDLAAVFARLGGGAFWPATGAVDETPLQSGLSTLAAFPEAPYWDTAREQCDAAELEAGVCLATDGSTITLAAGSGRGDTPVSAGPLPFQLRPPSNYHWRSNPYAVNGGGDGSTAFPGVDLRFTWWLGRWAKRR
jgi:hypothetical protein